ncbi:hypothetical protein EST38_g4842 [Candolleomyces aberdarensis]|uniref:beta-glucosidase n=1 Tax=Candolleomyces aberdarensis TaxID=2316362 RepID=A0A4Q2DPX2_9AGAR|nr:hypothetical protein EST38_g4842 [Candolleomyces aberdarensis]
MNRSFLDASVEDLVKKLKVDEKIALLGAPNWWNTTSIPRLEIPSIRMSDGPNGIRGSSHFVSTPAQCIPCATSLASTFDPELIYQAGVFLGKEAKIKSSVVLLAPTCNIQRTPLGGRSFESFSEDPHLSGTMAAAYVNGLQSEGVSATIKHLVGNDQEHERTAADSVVSERALREIYLYPFMMAQKHAQPGGYMTSYGRIKGVHCSENRELLTGILRDEWKFDGVVISDWFGTYGVDGAINAGLDLEMPGPPRWRTPLLVLHCLSAQKLLSSTIDERVTNLLKWVQRQARKNPDVVYGDGIERSRDTPEGRQFCRNLAAEGIVLLKNQGNVLPLGQAGKTKKILVTGANVHANVISGGGSAALKPTYVAAPLESIKQAAPKDHEIIQTVGCYAHKYLPTLESQLTTPSGEKGWVCTFYAHDDAGNPTIELESFILHDTRVKLNDFLPAGLTPEWTIKLRGTLTLDATGSFEFGLTVAGRAKLWLDDKLTIDNWTKQTPGDFFYGQGTVEEKATVQVTAGKPLQVLVQYTNTMPPATDENGEQRLSQPALMKGVRLGGCPKINGEEAIAEAVSLAKDADAVVVIAGLSPEWESEGFDRPSLTLPGRQDELIERLGAVNSNVIVVVQAGSAVSMPWVDKAAGILQTWYSGNEIGNALADVLFGNVNPGGRLPITLPVREQDIPAHLNDKCEDGQIHYREDLYVGYKHYQARGIKTLFPFGFGLSYTTFSLSELEIEKTEEGNNADALKVQAEVTLTNEGDRTGSEAVQLYVSYPSNGPRTPTYQLRAFSKERNIAPGASRRVALDLDKFAFAHWDQLSHQWKIAPGVYELHVGHHTEALALVMTSLNPDQNGSSDAYSSSAARKNPRDLTTLSEILSCLSAYQSEEAELSKSLTDLLNDREPIVASLTRLRLLIPQLDESREEAQALCTKVSATAKTAERVGSRVRSLDEEMGRVREAGDRVGQVMDLKSSLAALQAAIDAQDWESATTHCAKAMSLPPDVVAGPFAENAVPTSESHLPPAQTLQGQREKLLSIFRQKFDEASRSRDSTATTRFFKLFPAIGWEAEGLEAYAAFVVDLVRIRAPASAKTSSPLYFITALTALFESIAMIVDQHQPVVEKYYGKGKMRLVVQRLLDECDRVTKTLRENWEEDRNVKRKIGEVVSSPPITLLSINQRRAAQQTEDNAIDPREIDKVLSEVSGMIGRWNLFRKFVIEALTDDDATDSEDKPPADPPATPDSKMIEDAASHKLFEELVTMYYIPFEVWYSRTIIDKAHRISSPDPSASPVTTTAPDDAFYILKSVISRLLTTGSVNCISRMTEQLRDIIDRDYIAVYKKKLDDVYKNPVGASGPRLDKGERESRIAFITLLNDLDLSTSHLERLSLELSDSPSIAQHFLENDQPNVKKLISSLSGSTSKMKSTLRAGIEQLFNQLMRPRLRTFIQDVYKDISYVLNDEGYATAEYQDLTRKRFIKAWEQLMEGYKDVFSEANYRMFFNLTLDVIVRPWEKFVVSLRFTELGAIRFDRDLRAVTTYLSSQTAFGDVREKFLRMQQISTLLNLDGEEDVEEFYNGSGITWKLTGQEAKAIVGLRV